MNQREQATIDLVINGRAAETNLKSIGTAVNGVNRELRNMVEADDPARYAALIRQRNQLNDTYREMQNRINGVTEAMKESEQASGDFWDRVKAFATGDAIADFFEGAVDKIKDFASKVIEAYSTFEKFDAVLTNALGDSSKSKAALDMLSKFAAETPFGMEELTDSYIKFINRGITPTVEELRKFGDLAASQGKSFDQLTEAVLDAMTGEFERLKEFGIRANKNGDVIKLTFKGVTQEVQNSEAAITEAILKMGDMDGVAGGMEAMSKRIGGVLSNIEDNFGRLYNRIGTANGTLIFALATMINGVVEFFADARSEVEKLTDEFMEQSKVVNGLEKNTVPLINRYDELKKKGKLNKEEQVELKNVISQLANTIPSAVTQWDKLGNAMGINTDKAREYIKIQKALLKYQNQEAIKATQESLANLKKNQEATQRVLNGGKVSASGGGMASSQMRKMTNDEINESRLALQKIGAEITEKQALLKGLTGGFLDDAVKATATASNVVKSINEMTVEELEKHIKTLNDQLKGTVVNSKEYKQISAEIEAARKVLNAGKSDRKDEDKAKKEREATKKSLAELAKDYQEFDAARLLETESANQKEINDLEEKYKKQIDKQKEGLSKERITKQEADAINDRVRQLNADKDNAVIDLKARQEKKLTEDIIAYRDKLNNKLQSQRDQEEAAINADFNKQLENAATQEQRDIIEAGRKAALSDAKIREDKRYQDEKKRLEGEALVATSEKQTAELAAIDAKYDAEIEKLKERYQTERDLQDAIDLINQKRKADKDKVEAKDADAQKQKLKDFVFEQAQAASNAYFEISRTNRQRETDAELSKLDKQREKELANENLTEKQRAAITEKYRKQEADIKKKAWEADRAASIKQALINGALAVTKALSQTGVLAPLVIPGIIAATAAQVAVIAAAEPPEFAKGGYTGMAESEDPAGYVRKPTLFNKKYIAGEAGSEWIAPNWMLQNPYTANVMGALEALRLQGPGAISAAGGQQTTTPSGQNAPVQTPAIDLTPLLDKLDIMSSAIKNQEVKLNYQYFKRETDKMVKLESDANAKA